ncbi:ComF family protein [Streptomyces cinerochromogenes]|uniref:ComF family protein n=1 Tax=Streptomyces cinerochromogenes TaxID=66422 RepID=UPI00167076B4|nr:ComF family protein [Streptomyces cinerochromogenes]
MRGWWQDLTDLVLPADCAGCGAPRTALCPRCRATLDAGVPRRVRPVPEPAGLPVVNAVAPYAAEVRALLLAHKERGALLLAGVLGTALAGAVRVGLGEGGAGSVVGAGPAGAPGRGPVLLVPVPSSRWAVRARGHDPVRRMALAAAGELRRTGTPARVAAVLRQRRAVADQAGLDARRRLENLAGALEVGPGGGRLLGSGRVVLVDDLMTTGASLAEAARALREAAVSRREGGSAVYEAITREGREERRIDVRRERREWVHGAPEKAAPNVLGRVLHAAVIAAPRDSFEIARN